MAEEEILAEVSDPTEVLEARRSWWCRRWILEAMVELLPRAGREEQRRRLRLLPLRLGLHLGLHLRQRPRLRLRLTGWQAGERAAPTP